MINQQETATIILFRHGERKLNTGESSGDGPLLQSGRNNVLNSGALLTFELLESQISSIDLAIVSGSVRCVETYALVWGRLLDKGITVKKNDLSKDYFSTEAEDREWDKFYRVHGARFEADKKALGEKAAYLKHAGELIRPCVNRTVRSIRQALNAKKRTMLVVTHAPHDTQIEKQLTGHEPDECLTLGTYRIFALATP